MGCFLEPSSIGQKGANIVGGGQPYLDNPGPGPVLTPADSLTGDSGVSTTGEELGEIEASMLDVPRGRVAYAVLSFGGFLGMGNKLFAVPWEALTLNERDHEFILDVDRTVLEKTPGFDKVDWPDMADPHFATEVHQHCGGGPGGGGAGRTAGADGRGETGEK